MLEMRQQVVELRETESQRQKAVEELRASEKQYRTLVENIPQRLFMKDKNSVYTFCNENYAADLKIRPQEISGKTDYDFFPKELAEKYISDDKRVMATGQLENIEEKYLHEGQTRIVHTVKTPVRDERGDPIGVLGIFWDVTEQKRNEEEMRKYRVHLEELISNRTAELQTANKQWQREVAERRRVEESLGALQEKYRVLVENANEAIVVMQEGRLNFCNPKIFRISGYTESELISKPFKELIHPDDREMFEIYTRQPVHDNLSRVQLFRLIHKEKHIRWVENRGALIQWEGKPAVLYFMTDITDRKQAEEELRNSIEPFRALVNAMDKILFTLNSEKPKKENE